MEVIMAFLGFRSSLVMCLRSFGNPVTNKQFVQQRDLTVYFRTLKC